MIYNKDFCFIHVPKTAGMSLSGYFLENLYDRPVHYTVPPGHGSKKERSMEDVYIHEFGRHKNLPDSEVFYYKVRKVLKTLNAC